MREKLESYVYPGVMEVKIRVTRSSICGLVRFHNYNVNKRFSYYLDLALQHLEVSFDRPVICLDRDSFKLFYFVEHLKSYLQICVLPYDLFGIDELREMSKLCYMGFIQHPES